MRVVLSWLKDYVDLEGIDLEALAERWTEAGLELESLERIGDWWDPERLLVGAVLAVYPHPDAERLVLADVDLGTPQPHRVVTGAPNLMAYRDQGPLPRPLKVAFAREGATLFDGHAEGWRKTVLKPRMVRGVLSDAMLCSAKEIGLSEDHAGILILEDEAPLGRPLVEVLGDAVFELAITPNMARAMSMVGLARETAALFERAFRPPEPGAGLADAPGAPGAAPEGPALGFGVVIEDPALCPRYLARAIEGLRVGPSPAWLARRLSLAGMRPINNLVDITNYVMLEWGEPLHAFDYDKLLARAGGAAPEIRVRRARPGERMRTLDGVDRALDPDTLLITDAAGPLAIAGVMGGAETEIDAASSRVLLEAAAFDFISVRRTSRDQKLTSESAARFGRGVHPELARAGSERAAALMLALAGGRPAGPPLDVYPRPPEPVVIALPESEIARLLGIAIPLETAAAILERLELAPRREDGGPEGARLLATVPPHRMDLALPADLVEEIARVHGYARLPATRLADPLPPQREDPLAREDALRDALAALGLQEAISYHLTAPEQEARLHPGEAPAGEPGDPAAYVRLANPVSPERAVLRRSILTGLLEASHANLRFTDRVALFEIGPVYHPRAGEPLPDEPRRLGIVMTGAAGERGWREAKATARPLDFYDAKGALERALGALGLRLAWRRPEASELQPGLHPGRSALVLALGSDGRGIQPGSEGGGTQADGDASEDGPLLLGQLGELHPEARERWDLGERVVAVADLDLDAILRAAGGPRAFRPFSSYPAVRRDLAIVVDEAVEAEAVAERIRQAGGKLLVDLGLFDVFRDARLGAGRKSLAWSLVFQAPDKTLEGATVDKMRARIAQSLEAAFDAEIR